MIDKVAPISSGINDNQSITRAERQSLQRSGADYARSARELDRILSGNDPNRRIVPAAVADSVAYVSTLIMDALHNGDLGNALGYIDSSVTPSLGEAGAAISGSLNSSQITRAELREMIENVAQHRENFAAEMRSEGASSGYINAVLASIAETNRSNVVDTMVQIGRNGQHTDHDRRIGVAALNTDNGMVDSYRYADVSTAPEGGYVPGTVPAQTPASRENER